MNALEIFIGSDGDATRALYDALKQIGPPGEVALNLFRAKKASDRAKVYRGGIRGQGSFKSMAYERKAWAMENLCSVLTTHGALLGITWGWALDDEQGYHKHVLHVDIPTGQVGFHSATRGFGPDYPGRWDGVPGATQGRVVGWCQQLLDARMRGERSVLSGLEFCPRCGSGPRQRADDVECPDCGYTWSGPRLLNVIEDGS